MIHVAFLFPAQRLYNLLLILSPLFFSLFSERASGTESVPFPLTFSFSFQIETPPCSFFPVLKNGQLPNKRRFIDFFTFYAVPSVSAHQMLNVLLHACVLFAIPFPLFGRKDTETTHPASFWPFFLYPTISFSYDNKLFRSASSSSE